MGSVRWSKLKSKRLKKRRHMKHFDPKKMKLTKYEQSIEDKADEYRPVSKEEFEKIKATLEARRKNAVLNIRINQGDLDSLKSKAKRLGVKYQSYISEILHRIASAGGP